MIQANLLRWSVLVDLVSASVATESPGKRDQRIGSFRPTPPGDGAQPALSQVNRDKSCVLVFVMAVLSCSSVSGSWSLARGAVRGVWVLRCPVGLEHRAGCRLVGLGLSVVSSGCGLGVVAFSASRSSVGSLRRVSAGVRSAV